MVRKPTPFKVAISDEVLDDLRQRLARTRWPDEIPSGGWGYGTDLSYMKELTAYWQDQYEWRTHEATLNQFGQYTASVDGIDIHFVHEKGRGNGATPLLLLHGWPGSV
jgi:hypothetical protein